MIFENGEKSNNYHYLFKENIEEKSQVILNIAFLCKKSAFLSINCSFLLSFHTIVTFLKTFVLAALITLI